VKLKTLPPRIKPAPTHGLKSADSWRSDKTSSERGYNYAWQVSRVRFLRAHPLCTYCQGDGRVTPATVVDHIIPHKGDQDLFWDESNWQPLCAPCHDQRKKREEVGAG